MGRREVSRGCSMEGSVGTVGDGFWELEGEFETVHGLGF